MTPLDDSGMLPHLPRLVQTDYRVGLTDADCERLLAVVTGCSG